MSSQHPRRRTLPDDLFRGLASFRELEERIARLPEELERGDALEIFVEAYLWLTAILQVQDLWLVGQIPLDVRTALNLPSDQKGVDGAFRTRTGTLVPYQVKHRIERPKVGVAEVATFLGLTERATDRVLISNCDHYAKDIENRDYLRLITGTDFDTLTAADLQGIAAWLDGRPEPPTRYAPLPHQARALTDIATTLATHPRATVVMACGTGKTLVALWATEQQAPATVLVLVPSLVLLRQLLGEWSRQTQWGARFEYLCVCSDETVTDADATQMHATEVPFTVDTDPAVVRHFLTRPSTGSVRVVFSTYHSSKVVAEGSRGLAPFDVGIFDEAHKTTGERDRTFALALDDAEIVIRKRLFFTATPRHVNIGKQDRDGDFVVVSMDDPAVYGPRAHTLSFADAVAEDLICDYRVVVSVVDPAEVTAFALEHGITLVEGDTHATQWVAHQIAVSHAIAETGAQKVITFHRLVAHAQDFASTTSRGIGQFLEGFDVAHVNGTMSVADRAGILRGFAEDNRRIVTNVRCLTEGVDLPAVDMVAFCSPRRSRIDIIQAIGRAMRKPRTGDKTVGYVVVPILLAPQDATDLEAAARDTEWEDIVEVLAALRDADTRLEDLIRDAQIAKGRGDVFNPRIFGERIQVVGERVSLDVLVRHIGTVVLQPLGVSWNGRYGELVAFKTREGHCNVPKRYPANPSLGWWLKIQRRSKKAGTLFPERSARLEALGVVWDQLEAEWEGEFVRLEAFHAREGHCNVLAYDPANPSLGKWLRRQRRSKKAGTLSPECYARLEALGVAWDPLDATWERQFAALKAFKDDKGHCDVLAYDPANPSLGKWLMVQRMFKEAGTLSPERIVWLEGLGVVWDPLDAAWGTQFAALEAFKTREGHCNVPYGYPENPSLRTWLSWQRKSKQSGTLTLSPERIARLKALGVVWDQLEAEWEEQFAALEAFKTREGHCNVPKRYPANWGLWQWIRTQRTSKTKKNLSPERIERLTKLGVVWDQQDAKWDAQFKALEAFKDNKGHCDVPTVYPENPSLRTWLSWQRKSKRSGTLSPERSARLEALGVAWDLLDAKWETQFAALEAFKTREGHCIVLAYDPAHPSLRQWLNTQRLSKRSGTLSPERSARLEALGVVWDQLEAEWEGEFVRLEAFKTREGHCKVPYDYPANWGLGQWVRTQRTSKQAGTLSPERSARLEALGVVWDQLEAEWETQFAALEAFKTRERHCTVPVFYPAHPSLRQWLNTQRLSKRSGTLSPERSARLEALGVVWALRTQTRS